MIEIRRTESDITIRGHANAAEYGKDIVCASISTLAENLAYSVEELTADIIQYSVQPGTVDIEFGDLSEPAQLLVDSFFLGVEAIANTYPENVKVTKH